MNDCEKPKPASSRWLIMITLTVFFAALTAGGAYIAFPVGPIPITMQNLFILLSGLVLGPVTGAAAVVLYLLAGILNFPVFAMGSGGISRFTGPAGGYFAGYLFAAITAGLIAGRPKADTSVKTFQIRIIIAEIAGLLVSYIPGLIWYKIRMNTDWIKTFRTGLIPFIIGDTLKGIIAVLVAPGLRRIAAVFLDDENNNAGWRRKDNIP
ncbi:MAG: biotin transporter BioY [Treponema sp.]|jgi:biotin transport system substrate-specific component|nr:biotin transporter BioY [Treponema sp.]